MNVRPAETAASTAVPKATSAPVQAQRPEQAAKVPDSFDRKSGGGFHFPSPGDVVKGVRDGLSNIFDKVKGAVSDVFNGAKDLAQKAGDAVNKLITEDIPGYASRIKDAALDIARNEGGQKAINFLNNVGKVREKLGIDPPPRGLKPEEITELRKVFGDTVDYSKIKVHDNVKHGLVGSDRAMTLGNDIYMPNDKTAGSSYDSTLVHEMTHAWQFQNGGPDYATKAVEAQLTGPGGGYDWEAGVKAGQSWSQLNPEQQAQLIEDARDSGWFNNPSQRFVTQSGADYTDYLRSAVDQLRNRQGAP